MEELAYHARTKSLLTSVLLPLYHPALSAKTTFTELKKSYSNSKFKFFLALFIYPFMHV